MSDWAKASSSNLLHHFHFFIYHLPFFQGVEFKLEIKNLVLSDSKGCDLMKEVVVRATSSTPKQVSNFPS